MKIFAKVSEPVKPKTDNVKTIARFYAAVLVVFVVAQLFSFEEFIKIIDNYNFFSDGSVSLVVAALIVTIEIFALPFLLNMRVSKLMRIFSMIAGWLVAFTWVAISKWLVIFSASSSENVGFLGDVVELTPGWWAIFVSAGLGILSAWASWGMWPFAKKRLSAKR